jgi:hypothetical protein
MHAKKFEKELRVQIPTTNNCITLASLHPLAPAPFAFSTSKGSDRLILNMRFCHSFSHRKGGGRFSIPSYTVYFLSNFNLFMATQQKCTCSTNISVVH